MRRLRRHLRRPRPASIAATIAFFLAASGVGYATVAGSGTFQKENEIGLPGSPDPFNVTTETIRSIAGIGSIEAGCITDDGTVHVGLRNSSGESLQVAMDLGDSLGFESSLPNQAAEVISGIAEDEILQLHAAPADGTKAPQADVTVSVDHTGNCNTTQVAVLNVTTTSSGSGTVAGSGTVQKGALQDLPSSPVTVRSITGVGAVRVACNAGEPVVGISNTSGETLRVFRGHPVIFSSLELNDDQSQFLPIDATTMWGLYLFPANGSKRPQADVTISVDDTNNCATSQVSVLDVTTEQ